MRPILKLFGLSLAALMLNCPKQSLAGTQQEPFTRVTFKGEKGLNITADLYPSASGKTAPVVLLFHQARTSRGEYRQIAPELVKMGYNCLAVDTRAGGKDPWNNVENETTLDAQKKKMPNTYLDAYSELEMALKYVKENKFTGKIIIWGSSFSATLVFKLASEHHKDIFALLSFSPGEYFDENPALVSSWAKNVTKIPCFVSCGAGEAGQSKPVYEAIPGNNKKFYLPVKGQHGSSILLDDPEANWKPVKEFLKSLKRS